MDNQSAKSIGILLINLGTPRAPTTKAVRRFLAEFLSDQRVIEFPRLPWSLILHTCILPLRARRTANLYRKIWTLAGSPLLISSQKLAESLQKQLSSQTTSVVKVVLGMRYGVPSIKQALSQLHDTKIDSLLILPLYPQYSATTTASSFDAVATELKTWRRLPELKFVNQYATEPVYIEAIAHLIQDHWQRHGRAQKLIFSFHGLPKKYCDLGDPYPTYCRKSAEAVAKTLSLASDSWLMSYQSRFGSGAWLQPYTDQTLKQLPKDGIRSVDIVCPGFAVDCLETLEEISQTSREIFMDAGGKYFRYIPALNASTYHVSLLSGLIDSAYCLPPGTVKAFAFQANYDYMMSLRTSSLKKSAKRIQLNSRLQDD